MSDGLDISDAHRRLLDEIARETAETTAWTGRSQLSEPVMRALERVPRHVFVPLLQRSFAYDNRPLAIGHGQTISQPFIVAIMTELLDLRPSDRVLEVGTGCGYQAAVLAELGAEVFTIEVIPNLAETARSRLERLDYGQVHVLVGDGFTGLPDAAPFDAIIVTAAPVDFPPALLDQLAPGGRLVIPVGPSGDAQMLYRCVRLDDGMLIKERKLPVAFVPMVGGG